MGRFDRGGGSGGRRDFGRGRSFGGGRDFRRGGGGDRGRGGDRQMFDVVCSNCGKNCQVPFRPTGDKPVYCSDCFEQKGGGERRSFDRPRRDDRGGGGDFKGQLESLNTKLDKILSLLTPKSESLEVVSEPKAEVAETETKPEKKKRSSKKKVTEETPAAE